MAYCSCNPKASPSRHVHRGQEKCQAHAPPLHGLSSSRFSASIHGLLFVQPKASPSRHVYRGLEIANCPKGKITKKVQHAHGNGPLTEESFGYSRQDEATPNRLGGSVLCCCCAQH